MAISPMSVASVTRFFQAAVKLTPEMLVKRSIRAELSEGGADLARVGGCRCDEHVEILRRARAAVSGERVGSDHQEPDPMAPQAA